MYITANDDSEYAWQKFFLVDEPPTIFFNGKEVKYCFEADDEKGFIVVPVYNSEGGMVVDEFGNVEMATLSGQVEIRGGVRRVD
jgi:hypothetical protein